MTVLARVLPLDQIDIWKVFVFYGNTWNYITVQIISIKDSYLKL